MENANNERVTCAYKHPFSSWYSKITFYWLTSILRVGYVAYFEPAHFGQLPEVEKSLPHFTKFERIYCHEKVNKFYILYYK